MNISIGARTDVGGRSNNEDCLAVLDRDRVPLRADAVLIIADGMGGRANGEEASGIAVKVVRETLMEMLDPANEKRLPPAEDILAAAIRRANSTVYELSQEYPDTPGMGTTCIAALVSEGILTLAHVGDSRAYLIRGSSIKPLTNDHTYVADQVKAGNMSNDDARSSRFKNVITRAVGIGPTVQPDFETIALLDSDTILLCTDGLSNTLKEIEMLEVVSQSNSAQGTANALLEAAKAGGVSDNVTVIAVRVTADVQSGRIKLSENTSESNGNGTRDYTKLKPEARPAPAVKVTPQRTRGKKAPLGGIESIALASISAVIGAVVIAVALGLLGYLKTPEIFGDDSSGDSCYSSSFLPDYVSLRYQPPAQVYYKPLRPNFLIVTNSGVFVALQSSGRVVHLSTLGVAEGNVPADAIIPDSQDQPSYYAADAAGDLYESDGWSGSISQSSADGATHRQVVTGLTKPESIALDQAGDIFVIDNSELFEIRAIPDTEAP